MKAMERELGLRRVCNKAMKEKVLAIDSACNGILYLVDPKDKARMALSNGQAIMILTIGEAKTIVQELPEILAIYLTGTQA